MDKEGKMSKTNLSPLNLSKKLKCEHKIIYQWLEENNIKKKGFRYGIDYSIDEKTEQRFIEWLKGRREKNWTLNAVAKRNNCNITKVRRWLTSNNLKFSKNDIEQNNIIEKQLAESIKKRDEARLLKLSPSALSRKLKCDCKVIYQWLEENNIKKKGCRYGIDYFIDEKTEQQFIEWLKNRKERKKVSANGVAKRSGYSRQLVCVWAKENGIKKGRNQYMFTETQEKMFNDRNKNKRRGK